MNPWSGGGKAERFRVVDEARERGYEAVELHRGDDLRELVAAAIERGADGLAMAGGDGSQAIVAAAAAERGLPYACIPSGTRNHFALDLGVDRDDVVGALDAFVDGGEHVVDLAEVNGRVFVNNVSLGVYAAAVQREGYRDAKLRTLLATIPETLGAEGESLDLRWQGPGGHEHAGGAAVLVSNNRYRLGRALGTRRGPGSTTGSSGSPCSAPRAGAARAAAAAAPLARMVGADIRCRFVAPRRRPASTARPSCSPRRSAFGFFPAYCARGSPPRTPAPHRPRTSPTAPWHTLRELATIAAGRPKHKQNNNEKGSTDGHP